MTEEELIESDFYFTLMDAAYYVDHVGIDKFLTSMVEYCINPEQEQLVNQVISSLMSIKEKH